LLAQFPPQIESKTTVLLHALRAPPPTPPQPWENLGREGQPI
jgi:hypothetical protein